MPMDWSTRPSSSMAMHRLVKAPPSEYAALLAEPGVTPFAPDGERPMGSWLVVAADAVADDPELAEWVARGLRAVR